MKFIISNYNFDCSWVKKYTKDYIVFDRSNLMEYTKNLSKSKVVHVSNIGSDIYDKLTYIIDHYDDLPDIAVYTKGNLFKYITEEEFEQIIDTTTFTPLLTKNHKTYLPICYYDKNGMYNELNNFWYLGAHPCKDQQSFLDLVALLNNHDLYMTFAPGSNYILPRDTILKHTKVFYMKLREFLEWSVYPGEAQIIERNLYTIWK